MESNSNDVKEDKSSLSNSWEIEILISGGAFYSLYQLSITLLTLSTTLGGDSFFGFSMLLFVGGAIRILAVYFAIHLSVRAFWLSLVLIRKNYPNGINTAKFKLAEPFQSITNKYNIDQRIAFTDKFSGLIFSWAVTFVIALVGISLSLSLVVFILMKVELTNIVWRIFVGIIYLSLWIFLIDTFFYGIIRRSKFLAKLYYPIYLLWNTISLGFLWRPNLQMIFTNVKSKWRTSILVLSITLVVALLTGDEDDYQTMFNSHKNATEMIIADETRYLDKRKDETKTEQRGSFIQSDVITGNALKVFVVYNGNDDKRVDSLEMGNKYFSKIVELSIDDSVYLCQEWIGINRINGQKGIQTVIDISHLKNKLHVVKIKRSYEKDPLIIPFWKIN